MDAHASALAQDDVKRSSAARALLFMPTALLLWLITTAAADGSVHLEWDPVDDSRVDHYVVHYGVTSGEYDERIETTATSLEIPNLVQGVTYYFAARACNAAETECSDFSNELITTMPYSDPEVDSRDGDGESGDGGSGDGESGDGGSGGGESGDGGSRVANKSVYTYEELVALRVTYGSWRYHLPLLDQHRD